MTFREYARHVRSELETGGMEVVVLSDVDSTNAVGRRLMQSVAEDAPGLRPTLVLAWRQSAGRGRLGRRWESDAGLGIYLTLLVPPAILKRTELGLLPLIVGIGACRALRTVVPEISLKWPNDLVVGPRKLGGILIETVSLGPAGPGALVGIGVNHGHAKDQLPITGSTSLAIEAAGRHELPEMAAVAGRLAEGLLLRIEAPLDRDQVLSAYRRLSVHRVGDVLRCSIQDRRIEGEFLGFDEAGRLLVQSEDHTETLVVGEIIESDRERT